MRNIVRVILLVWFAVVSLFIFIPSYQILSSVMNKGRQEVQGPPPAPDRLILPPVATNLDPKVQEQQVQSYKQRVDAYTQQVTAYTQQVSAYKAQLDSEAKDPKVNAYDTVVKGTLATLLASFFAALIGYVFTNAGASLLDNVIRAKKGEPLEDMKLW